MKKAILFLIVFSILMSSSFVFASGNVNIFFGKKNIAEVKFYNSLDLEVDKQDEFGLMLDFNSSESSSLYFALDFYSAKSDGIDFFVVDVFGNIIFEYVNTEYKTQEICVGVRKYVESKDFVSLFVGGGLGYFKGEISGRETWFGPGGESDSAIGPWFCCGLSFNIENINLGLMVRWSYAELDIKTIDAEAGGTHYGAFIGMHWD